MAHRRPRGRGISQAQRRKKSWVTLHAPAVGSSGATDGLNLTNSLRFVISGTAPTEPTQAKSVGFFSTAADLIPPEATILRIRGSVDMPTNTNTDTDIFTFAMGIGVLESSAAALGAFPNPADPIGAAWDGWMWYRSVQDTVLDSAGATFDVKSMRKVQSGYSLIVVFGAHLTTSDSSIPSPGITGIANLSARALILLP